MELAVLVGIILVVVGVVMLAAPDLAWSIQEWTNSGRGQVSERTDGWETRNRIGAAIAIVVGIGLAVLGIGGR
jgi:hypothetical protein